MNLATILDTELPRLYAFAYLMCASRDEAFNLLLAIVRALAQDAAASSAVLCASSPKSALLGEVARRLEQSLGRNADTNFRILDNLLCTEESQPIGEIPLVSALLWELKRTCLASVLGCLPPGVRVAFLLTDVLGFAPGAAAELLNIKESALRVRITRARRRLEDFLGPRCGHMHRNNPCYCEGRLAHACQAGFVRLPPHTEDTPARAYNDGPPAREIAGLYGALPPVVLTDLQRAAILAAVS